MLVTAINMPGVLIGLRTIEGSKSVWLDVWTDQRPCPLREVVQEVIKQGGGNLRPPTTPEYYEALETGFPKDEFTQPWYCLRLTACECPIVTVFSPRDGRHADKSLNGLEVPVGGSVCVTCVRMLVVPTIEDIGWFSRPQGDSVSKFLKRERSSRKNQPVTIPEGLPA